MARSQQGARMTNRKRWSAAFIAGVIAVVGAMSAASLSAMVVVPAEFSEMVTASELVVHGRVVEIRPQIVGDRRSHRTVVTLESVPRRSRASRVRPCISRARRPDRTLSPVMVGAPEFAAGDEVVLFLKGRPPAVPFPFGLSQGVYRVVRDENGRSLVTRPSCPRQQAVWCAATPRDVPLLSAFTRRRSRDC